jgi:phenylacetate-coenzyme A ligase PaaK-like adenylate-forming protein
MSVQSIAAIASEPNPESGQKNRSSPNFQFLSVPSSESTISVQFTGTSGAAGITATLMHDLGGSNDEVIASLTQNGSFSASKVSTGNYNYYIASPDNASTNFVVYFQGNV